MSLSHDGHFGAYAVLIRKPERNARGPWPSAAECEQEHWLAICQEPFMKQNNTFWNLFGKWQGKENFLRNFLVNQF